MRTTPDEESPQEEGVRVRFGRWARFTAVIAPIAALFIMAGEASDAAFLLQEMGKKVVALFSNRVEYDVLASIHEGNTVAYVEERVGTPQVSRVLEEGLTANYVKDPKYLITLFYRGPRVAGFTVIATRDAFAPEVDLGGGDDPPLGEFTFSEAPAAPKAMRVDHSRSTSYYLETLETGPEGRFVDLYLGSIAYGAGGAASEIDALYRAQLHDRDVAASQRALRESARPNLYGEGRLSLDQIEAALLTNAEFQSYFGSD